MSWNVEGSCTKEEALDSLLSMYTAAKDLMEHVDFLGNAISADENAQEINGLAKTVLDIKYALSTMYAVPVMSKTGKIATISLAPPISTN
jgi:hypothetical protein